MYFMVNKIRVLIRPKSGLVLGVLIESWGEQPKGKSSVYGFPHP